MINKIIRYFLENRVITILLLTLVVVWGISTAPFNWHGGIVPRNPIPVDAIPDIGDNQQIVATEWMGRSPKDIQDQITYPLTTSLLGIPGVRTIRSSSMFGMSYIGEAELPASGNLAGRRAAYLGTGRYRPRADLLVYAGRA